MLYYDLKAPSVWVPSGGRMNGLDNVRDVAIIVLAIESIVVGAALVFLVFQIRSLIRILQEEIKPLLDSANVTVSTVRGTTTFVSEKVVNPIVSVASTFSAVQGGIRSAAQWLGRRGKRSAGS
jgi:hypothetical protein